MYYIERQGVHPVYLFFFFFFFFLKARSLSVRVAICRKIIILQGSETARVK
jgi:hypothetical protein